MSCAHFATAMSNKVWLKTMRRREKTDAIKSKVHVCIPGGGNQKKNKVFSRQLSSPFPPQSNTAKGEGGETSILQTTDFCSLPAFEGMMPGGI